MSISANQQHILLRLLAALRPHWHRDPALPSRIQHLLTRNRQFGSRDRRLYRELIYTALRYLPWIDALLKREPSSAVPLIAWLSAETSATHLFRASLAGDWPPCPRSGLAKAEIIAARSSAGLLPSVDVSQDLLPSWFREHCPDAFTPDQIDTLLARAPLWLRLQTTHAARVLAEFTSLEWSVQASPLVPEAIELRTEADVTHTKAYTQGLIEIQDLGSQLLLPMVGVNPGEHWLDGCAGAGGKTLQLAGLLGPNGRIDAHDVRPAALRELTIRARRAGIEVFSPPSPVPPALMPPATLPAVIRSRTATIKIVPSLATGALYDSVLVDAPCTGTGTWRRAPHLKWTTTPAQIEQAAHQQLALLGQFASHVRPGGKLVYATCSLSRRENQDVVSAFLAAHPGFQIAPLAQTFGFAPDNVGVTILPAHHNTDGFYVAALRRK